MKTAVYSCLPCFLLALLFTVTLVCCCSAFERTNHRKLQEQHDPNLYMEQHLSNPVLLQMIAERCKFDSSVSASPSASRQRITFSHLPKTGGTSVRMFFDKYAKDRTRPTDHEHFLLAALDEPDNVFVTMLREPVARAISFYCYVKGRSHLHKEALKNKMWVATFNSRPLEWSADPFIKRTMYQDPLGFFLRDVTNITDSISKYDYKGHIQKLPEVPLKKTIPGTLEAFLNYTTALPDEYQCREHLEVAFILLKHYEVVGTLEKISDFYRVLFRRAHFPPSITLNDTDFHENKSSFRIEPEIRKQMVKNLERPLFCNAVLWRIAGMLSDKDVTCVV